MAFSNQGLPSYSFVMFLAFAAFGSYIWSSDPLKTARPPTQNLPVISTANVSTIPARLWQDPFRVIYARDKANKPLPIEKLEKTGLLDEIKQQLKGEAEELLVLGVMVSTEAIADAEERRRRHRYALVNALSEAGYVPENARHIQVGEMSREELGDGSKVQDRLILPYEWFKQDKISPVDDPGTGNKKVLLLWLDSSHYRSTPYLHLYQLAKYLAADENIRQKMRYAILGPATSSGLAALAKQADKGSVPKLCSLNIAGMHILSPVATIADDFLYQAMPESTQWLEQRFSIPRYQAGQTCLTFHRTVHSDDQLMLRLVMELNNRGIAPGKNHVVLLSERDTAFGRALPESFSQAFCGCFDLECRKKYIHTFSYLRGIDGVAPGSSTDLGLATSKSSATKSKGKQQNPASAIRRPVGSGQFDYLRRVADEIVRLDKKLRKQDGKGILAVGVLGSDVYDKLLILRALRSRLMGMMFFTTDLDAQFLHPAEFPWTRNLVVASSFNLKLNEKFQGTTPPFRNNYQTSVFYSAGLALQLPTLSSSAQEFHDRAEMPTRMKPQLFEIGRNGAVSLQPLNEDKDQYGNTLCGIRPPNHTLNEFHSLTAAEDSSVESEPQRLLQSQLHPTIGERELLSPLLVTIAIIILALLALLQLSSGGKTYLPWLGAGLLMLALVTSLGIWCSLREEPFILLAGVSVWPTEIINSLTLVLSLYFICTSLRALNINYYKMSEKYYLLSWAESMSDKYKTAMEKGSSCYENDKNGNSWKVILGFMLLVSASLVALLPRSISYGNIPLMLIGWGGVILSWFVITKYLIPVASINCWEKEVKKQEDTPVQDLWKSYGEHGSLRNRFMRAFMVVLIFQAFVSFIFTLFGLEPPPLRGEYTRVIDSVITVASVLGMLFLLFYMVDATRLCIIWIRGLTKNNYDWRGTKVDELAVTMNIPWSCAVHWIKLKLVAERTEEVSKLIYYPFIVIILILFSRISYFDDWGFPQSMAIITSSLIAIALYAAIKLRREAEVVRSDFIKYLHDEKIAVSGSKTLPGKPNLAQLNELADSVAGLGKGAFQPFLEQPVVKASLLLLGGVGFSASQFTALL